MLWLNDALPENFRPYLTKQIWLPDRYRVVPIFGPAHGPQSFKRGTEYRLPAVSPASHSEGPLFRKADTQHC